MGRWLSRAIAALAPAAPRAMASLILALLFLSIVPVPGREAAGPGALGRAAWWFPVVGLALGGGPMLTVVYLVRHGAPVGAETGRFIGHLDVPLSPRGEAQLEALARRLAEAPITAVYASDLSRTRRSAEILAAPHGLTPVAVTGLREFAMGRWEGLTARQIRDLDAAAFDEWMGRVGEFQFPEGESLAQVAERAWAAFERIVAAHAGEGVAVVAHGGTNRAILCRALGLPLPRILALGQDYAGLSILELSARGWRLRTLNDRDPLL